MANDTTRNPWIIDTASATAILTSWADVRSFQWIGATAAGHELVVQDQDGRVIWRRLSQGDNHIFESIYENRYGLGVNGLIVPTIGSGTLYITFAQTNVSG